MVCQPTKKDPRDVIGNMFSRTLCQQCQHVQQLQEKLKN